MSSTILMVIVLVVMWLVVLVPMFVRRHDDRAETRSMDRFATAMRVLSRRSPGSGGVAGRRRYAMKTPAPYAEGASPVRTAARTRMIRRRRRTLSALSAAAFIGLPAAAFGSSWVWFLELPLALLLAAYVVWLRQQVRREQARRFRRAALFARPAAERGTPPPSRQRPPVRSAPVTSQEGDAPEDRSWRPTPVPTPTCVTAAVARRRADDTLVELDDDDLSFADLDPYGDAVERPRAVNE
jgi:hypothetical protein